MTRRGRVLVSTVLIGSAFAFAAAVGAGAEGPAFPSAERALRVMEVFAERAQIPGLAVAVARADGRMLWSAELGWADLEQKVPVRPETRFRVGSISKTFTAAALVRLHEQGRLDLDAPVQRYVPSFPEKQAPITLRQLAGHLSGIRHYRDQAESLNREPIRDLRKALEQFQADPLKNDPGAAYLYSSFGYVLLGVALEQPCGVAYDLCMEREVFQPLGMARTVTDLPERVVPDRTRFYERREGETWNAPYSDRMYKLPAGGYLSTTGDLVRFGAGLLGGGYLKPETARLLFTSQKTTAGKETGYGMGWRPAQDWKGRAVVHHGGDAEGGRAFMILYPQQDLILTFLANRSGAPFFEQEAYTLADLFLGGVADLSDADWKRVAGSYEVTVAGEEGKPPVRGQLQLTGPNGGWLTLEDERRTALEIGLAVAEGEEIRLVGAGGNGLMNLWATFGDDGFKGRWNWLGKTTPIEGVRLGARR